MSAEEWNARYSESGFAYGTEPNDFLKSAFRNLPKGDVLMLADGEGRNGVFLATQGYRVTSVDWSSVGLEKAQALARERGVQITTKLCDLAEFRIEPCRWDGIVSIFCHLPKPARQRLHWACVQGLKQDGTFLLEAYSRKQLRFGTGGPKREELLMSLDETTEELRGLTIELAQEIERDVFEGKYHAGRSAVIQIIARKSQRR
ncbi:MAG: class I SAM-dependent methyltransferase [Chloroherpetonaceae bacterium]|nr:class I SAM-dependent methyltransferase [Chloroherpetonaceae bacterium]